MKTKTYRPVTNGIADRAQMDLLFHALSKGHEVVKYESQSQMLGFFSRPTNDFNIEVELRIPDAEELNPGDEVYSKIDGKKLLVINMHPLHPVCIVETTENEFVPMPVSEITKEKVVTPLNIPWEVVGPKYKWATMDQDGEIDLWQEKPLLVIDETYKGMWKGGKDHANKAYLNVTGALNVKTDGVVWHASLTERPEPKDFLGPEHINCRCVVIASTPSSMTLKPSTTIRK